MRLGLSLLLAISLLLCSSCTTRGSGTAQRLWHQFSLQYNALYNADEAFRTLRTEQLQQDSQLYRLALPLDVYSDVYAEGYQVIIAKLERAILEHSLRVKPPKSQQAYKGQIEFNRSMYRAWLLLGEAQFYSGSLEQAEQSFAHIRWLYKGEAKVYNHALLWQCRCLIALGRSSDADILMQDLASYEAKLRGKTRLQYDWFRAEYALSQTDYASAQAPILRLVRTSSNPALKARLYYALALILHYGQQNSTAASTYLRKALSYLPSPTAKQRMRYAYAQSAELALQLPGRKPIKQDSLPQPNDTLALNTASSDTIYPIDWLRIYEDKPRQANEQPKPSAPSRLEHAQALQLTVQASDISLGEYLFLLSSYNFKHFTQLPLRIELLSSSEDSSYRVRITGFRHSSELQAYIAGLSSALPLPLSLTPIAD